MFQNGLESDTCELDCTLHNIVGGRKRCVVQTIQAETGTSIYLAPGTFGWLRAEPDAAALLPALASTVMITGPRAGVQRAREMLLQIASHKTSVLLHKPADLPPGKRDWLLLHHHSKLAEIARDNATFLSLPPLGSDAPNLIVYGDNRASIERTLRAVMALSTELYLASIQLASPVPRVINPGFEAFSTPARPVEPFPAANRNDSVADVVQAAATASGAEVAAQQLASGVWGMELSGTAAEVKAALAAVLNHTWTQSFEAHVTVNLELATEHRDFLSGKKNGKVNKIMRLSNVQIVYNEGNAYNFVIQLSAVGRGWDLADPSPGPLEGAERSNVLLGLTCLQEELPAEIAFYVPEAYHKRIIGVGGKNIQRIMKRYGVYVKFSSAEEAAWGGCLPTEDNVVARTPAKNAAGSLLPLKQAVLEMVAPKDRDFTTLRVPLARTQHRVLASERAVVLHDLEARTSCSITFPPRESGEDSVTLYGPSVQLPLVAHVVLEQVPYQASLQVRPPNASLLQDRLASPEFGVLLDVLRCEYSVRATVWQAPVDAPPSPPLASDKDAGVHFHLVTTRAQVEWVPIAKQMLTTFFSSGSHPPTPASISTPLVSPSVRTMGLPSRFSTPASLPDSPVYRPHLGHPLPPHPARYVHGSLPEQERRALPPHARHNSHASHRSFGSGGSNVSAGPPPPLPLPPQAKRYATHTHTLSGNLLWNKPPERDWANASPRARAVWDNTWPTEVAPSPGPNPVGSPVWATTGRTERAHSLDYRVPPRIDRLERREGYEAFDGAAVEPPFDPTATWEKLDPPFAPTRARALGPLGLYEPEPYGELGEAPWEPDPYDPSLHDARMVRHPSLRCWQGGR